MGDVSHWVGQHYGDERTRSLRSLMLELEEEYALLGLEAPMPEALQWSEADVRAYFESGGVCPPAVADGGATEVAGEQGASKLDLVVYGATGVVGTWLCRLLAKQEPAVKWGIAGRDAAKLEAVKVKYGCPFMVVPSGSLLGSLAVDAVVRSCKVLINTAGPYRVCGPPMIEACARLGVHHLDLTGEYAWVAENTRQHHQTAQQSRAALITMCGPEEMTIPDVAVQLLAAHLDGKAIRSITLYQGGDGKMRCAEYFVCDCLRVDNICLTNILTSPCMGTLLEHV